MKQIDEERRRIMAEWLHKAQEDLRSAEILINSEQPAPYNACFLAQQSVEKFLKAFLTKHQIEFRKTHDINELLDEISSVDRELSEKLTFCAVLNLYGVVVRYPSDMPEPTEQDAREALEIAKTVKAMLEQYFL